MLLSAHQPAYLPWLGYLEKIARADVFIYMDTVQFEKNSFTNRNKIKGPNGPQMLTIPVCMRDHMNKIMLEMQIEERSNWRQKHLNAIFCNYKKAPYFCENFPKLERLYEDRTDNLSDFIFNQLMFWVKELGLTETKIIRQQELNLTAKKSDLVYAMCEAVGADQYLSGAMGADYLDKEKFLQNGIDVLFQDYHCDEYPQLWGDFVPAMGVVDMWMNTRNYDIIVNK